MKKSGPRLQLEELEPKLLPSTTSLVLPVNPGGPAILQTGSAQPLTKWQTLKGKATGSYTFSPLIVDASPQYQLSGQGMVTPLGTVTVAGTVQGVGFLRYGRAGGTLTLTGTDGSVRLELTGPTQNGFSRIPTHFTYDVVSGSGTGAFKNYKAAGTIDLQFSPSVVIDPLPPVFPFTPVVDPVFPIIPIWPRFGGTFTLSIHPTQG